MTKLLILAQNPKTQLNVLHPMAGTPSLNMLRKWLNSAGVKAWDYDIKNAYDDVGQFICTTSRMMRDVKSGKWNTLVYKYPIIITLGKVAEHAIVYTSQEIGIYGKYFHLPHPSGLNRQLNNPDAVKRCIRQLREAYADFLMLEE